ncbi:RluA family pseudouridine synthase [Blattabacterium cuenoti]|uniref:RluA family pseudouridine synthase n=1 Tax=Blattabacterium cuenoti TaxID=1653831 RepID=UPI00163D2E94|nr:RluA family pseudouridine synthase [Blattabacterium cuenoti]
MRIITDKNQHSIRIDKFLMNKLQNISRNQIQKFLKYGNIYVNNQIIKKNYKIKPFDSIECKFFSSIKNVLELEQKNLHEKIMNNMNIIFYEDKDIIIVNKPSNMVVHPGCGNEKNTLIHYMIQHHPYLSRLDRFGLIHRLDKNTTGLLVFAKNIDTQKFLKKQFQLKIIRRKYIALVWGDLKNEKGHIKGFIGRNPKNRKKMMVFPDNKEMKKNKKYSVTHYKVLERFKDLYLTCVSCELETGRTHQIRAHFKHLGNPIFGDEDYGGRKIFMKKRYKKKYIKFFDDCLNLLKRQALHAISLHLIHPKYGKCFFSCPIPNDFDYVIQQCQQFLLQ